MSDLHITLTPASQVIKLRTVVRLHGDDPDVTLSPQGARTLAQQLLSYAAFLEGVAQPQPQPLGRQAPASKEPKP